MSVNTACRAVWSRELRLPPNQPARDTNDTTWDERRLADPHRAPDKAKRVEAMFAAIAPRYDLNNRVHSLWRDQAWRRAAVRMAELEGGEVVADVACGTGDLAMAFADELARRGSEPGRVIGLDFTQEMLDIAEDKKRDRPIAYLRADAMDLPLDDESVDVVSIAFGIRNVTDPHRALREFHRVLKPGGRLVVLEFCEPRNPAIRLGNAIYCKRIMPVTATLIARDRSGAYRYLPKSVEKFLDRDALAEAIEAAGFEDVRTKPVTFGIAALHRGVKGATGL